MSFQYLIEKILFRPVKLKADHVFNFDKDFEEINFNPDPDTIINALHFKVKAPKGIILYFHGNKDNLVRWGSIASELTKYNYDVVAIDYRSYGKSKGSLSEKNLFDDALFCYNQIKESSNPKHIILYGRSLGTGIASWLAGEVNPAKLILETPYYDIHDLIKRFFPDFLLKDKLNYKFSSHTYLKNSKYPLMIFHGTRDEVVPYRSGKKLFDSLRNPNKTLITIDGGRHNDLYSFPEYWNELKNFLEETGYF